jgi:aerobic carbon-monoxide dehydrogenase medium subunit
VFPEQFEYHRPGSVSEAVQLLSSNPEAKIIAGGHSLLPAMKLRLAVPAALVDIAKLPDLKGISVDGGARIGAMTTYRELIASDELAAAFPMFREAADKVGDPAVRARGTIGGSLAHADPAADLTAVMLALGGSVKAVGSNGERTIDVDDLFVGLLTTSLEPEEVITEVTASGDTAGSKMAYEKHAHPASGYAVVGVAVALTMDGDTCKSARIGVTGAPEVAKRAESAESALNGQKLDADTIAAAADKAADDLGELNGDVYASPEYRAHLVKVLTKRALTRAAGL